MQPTEKRATVNAEINCLPYIFAWGISHGKWYTSIRQSFCTHRSNLTWKCPPCQKSDHFFWKIKCVRFFSGVPPPVFLSLSLPVFLGHKFLMNSEPWEWSASSCEIYAFVSITVNQCSLIWDICVVLEYLSSMNSNWCLRISNLKQSTIAFSSLFHIFLPFWDKWSQNEQDGRSCQCEVSTAAVKDVVSVCCAGYIYARKKKSHVKLSTYIIIK